MKLAVLTPNRFQSNLLINNLVKNDCEPDLVMYYAPIHHKGLKKNMIFWGKEMIKQTLLFNSSAQRIKRKKKYLLKQATQKLADWASTQNISSKRFERSILVQNVNNQTVIQALKQHTIDVLLVWGIPILKPNVIQVVNDMVINAHSSILPEYRGTAAEFWQFVNGDFKQAGITLHQVNERVDEGHILMQVMADEADLVSPELLRMMNAKRVIEAAPLLLNKLKENTVLSTPQSTLPPPETKTYTSKDVTLAYLQKVYLEH